MVDGFADLPSVAELLERVGRHQREMLHWVDVARPSRVQSGPSLEAGLAVQEDAVQASMLAAVVRAEIALLELVTAAP